MSRDLPAAIRSLLRTGLTIRDVAELFRAHPKAIEALIAKLRMPVASVIASSTSATRSRATMSRDRASELVVAAVRTLLRSGLTIRQVAGLSGRTRGRSRHWSRADLVRSNKRLGARPGLPLGRQLVR